MAGTRPITSLESVNWLTSTGTTVSLEMKLMPNVMKVMSHRLTEKFQLELSLPRPIAAGPVPI